MSRLRTTLRSAAAIIALLLACSGRASAQQGYYNEGGASYQEFYDELSPYGEWMNDPDYGYVWVPDAGADFRPYYSNGYWANTDYGNTWVSNYSWGWAPFHYGRWTYNSYYGWVWIPGNTWGPAWVSWRSGGGCYGWAPLGPGISVNVSFGSGYYVPDYWWTFTPQQYVLSPNFHNYCYRPRYNTNYIHQTTIINNTYVYNHNTYITGPRRRELEQSIGRPVQPVAINTLNRPGRGELRGNSLSLYRPAINETAPRSTERPREFRAADRPIVRDNSSTAPARGPGLRPDRGTATGQEAAPASGGNRFSRQPERAPQSGTQEQRMPVSRGFERETPSGNSQPRSSSDDHASQIQQQRMADQRIQEQRMADQRAQEQRMQAQREEAQRAQRDQMVRQEQMQRQQIEQQRAQQREMEANRMAQQQQQQRMAEQQRQQAQQRFERPQAQPRMETPQQAQPQRGSSLPQQGGGQPARGGGGEGRRPFGR